MKLKKELYKLYTENPHIYIDNRKVAGPGIFFAIKGDKHDGNQYALSALDNGATVAVIDNPLYQLDSRFILVDDALVTLQQLSSYHRDQMDIPVLAITGTNGKTTTKELVSEVLNQQIKCHVTCGNFNNHIGLPLTILSCPFDADIMVLEMGASKPKDIDELCQIAKPTYGLITNIGLAHLEGFGDFDHIYTTKKELFDYVHTNRGKFFLNRCEPSLEKLKEVDFNGFVSFGGDLADIQTRIEMEGIFAKVTFNINDEVFICRSNLIGFYNGHNVAAAIAIGLHFQVKPEKIVEAIDSYHSKNNRSQIIKKREASFVLDCYNANPTSMTMAIEAFAQIDSSYQTLILGDMLELGRSSLAEHQKIIALVSRYEWDKVVLVGDIFGQTVNHNFEWHQNIETIDVNQFTQGWILIKGSRGLALEKLLLQQFK